MRAQRNVLLALAKYDYRTPKAPSDYCRVGARYAGEHSWHLNSEMCISGRLPRGWKGDGILTALDFQPHLLRFVRSARVPLVDISLTLPTRYN